MVVSLQTLPKASMAPHRPWEAQQPHPFPQVMSLSKVLTTKVLDLRMTTDRKFLVLFVMTNLVANIMVNLLVKVVRAFSKDRFDET